MLKSAHGGRSWNGRRTMNCSLLLVVMFVSAGCLSHPISDLRLAGVEITTSVPHDVPAGFSDWSSRFNKLLKVQLKTDSDVRELVLDGEYHVVVEGYMCAQQSHELSMMTYIFDNHGVYGDAELRTGDVTSTTLWFYVAPHSEPRIDPITGSMLASYDLEKKPSDLCFRIRGGNMMAQGFVSNEVKISSDRLRHVFGQES